MENNQYDDDDDGDIICPSCSSDEVEEIPESERNYSLGLYALYDFVGGVNKVFNRYRCSRCGYEY